MSDARQYTAIVIVLLIMPDSGYYAARQRRVLAVTRQWAKVLDATTLLVSVERWPNCVWVSNQHFISVALRNLSEHSASRVRDFAVS